ncbi:NAD-dependent epimerase/dehydratase family protein, partial [Alphaproteobacteria bacterium]|nr:NAD-dependent epimerase/dehydratase family protein [Alphaproteobacteria bacterium]
TTIVRFFTVYGPWGRPDMALFKFTKNILSQLPIDIYNYGDMKRDFTNIHDLIDAINLLIDIIPICPDKRKNIIANDSLSNTAPYRIVNIGNSKSINLLKYVEELENALKMKAIKNFIHAQDGDLIKTSSDITLLKNLTGFTPYRKLKDGIREFVNWYTTYYK